MSRTQTASRTDSTVARIRALREIIETTDRGSLVVDFADSSVQVRVAVVVPNVENPENGRSVGGGPVSPELPKEVQRLR